jgi:hypothetical protein
LLVVVGGLFLAGEQLNIGWGDYGWPLFVIVPGLVLFVLGLTIRDEVGLGMTIPGGIVTAVGLVLLYQSTYDAYASWAYAWALVAPGSVGVSLFSFGVLHRKLDLVDAGLRTAAVGLGLFVGRPVLRERDRLEETGSTPCARTAIWRRPARCVLLSSCLAGPSDEAGSIGPGPGRRASRAAPGPPRS